METDEQLFADLGITAQTQEHVEQAVINQVRGFIPGHATRLCCMGARLAGRTTAQLCAVSPRRRLQAQQLLLAPMQPMLRLSKVCVPVSC